MWMYRGDGVRVCGWRGVWVSGGGGVGIDGGGNRVVHVRMREMRGRREREIGVEATVGVVFCCVPFRNQLSTRIEVGREEVEVQLRSVQSQLMDTCMGL